MTARGSIHLVGVGAGDESLLTLGALRAIEEAQEIWATDLGPWNHERAFLRPRLLGKKVVNTSAYYALPPVERGRFYRLQARRLAHLASRGRRITFLLSGNPWIWVDYTTLLAAEAREGRFDLRVSPGVSFLDVVWEGAPFDSAAFDLRLGGLSNPPASAEVDTVVGQVADDGRTTAGWPRRFDGFGRQLARLHPPTHPVFVTGADPVSGERRAATTDVASLPGVLESFEGLFYCVLIPGRRASISPPTGRRTSSRGRSRLP